MGKISEHFAYGQKEQKGTVMDRIYSWQAVYMAAICETDDTLIEGRILEALSSLEERLLSPIEGEEALAIAHAAAGLQVLKAERGNNLLDSRVSTISTPSQSRSPA
jgi:hypothetical protein